MLNTRHEVLHVHRLLPHSLSPQANRRGAKQYCADQRPTDADPSNHVRPVVRYYRVVLQHLYYRVQSPIASVQICYKSIKKKGKP